MGVEQTVRGGGGWSGRQTVKGMGGWGYRSVIQD